MTTLHDNSARVTIALCTTARTTQIIGIALPLRGGVEMAAQQRIEQRGKFHEIMVRRLGNISEHWKRGLRCNPFVA